MVKEPCVVGNGATHSGLFTSINPIKIIPPSLGMVSQVIPNLVKLTVETITKEAVEKRDEHSRGDSKGRSDVSPGLSSM